MFSDGFAAMSWAGESVRFCVILVLLYFLDSSINFIELQEYMNLAHLARNITQGEKINAYDSNVVDYLRYNWRIVGGCVGGVVFCFA